MILSSALAADGACYRYLVADSINPDVLRKAAEIFEVYRNGGTILSGSMQDDAWTLTNERQRVTLCFQVSEPAYRKNASEWLGCSRDTFTLCLKAFILMKMGDMELPSLRDVCNSIRSLAEASDPLSCELHYAGHAAQFLRLLPGSSLSREEVAQYLGEIPDPSAKRGSQRLLSDFSAYLQFHDSFRDAWASAGEEDRLFLFPLWLWWNLTTILPLRPTEFVLTPYDCLVTENQQEKIRIRRTHLKGIRGKISYSIDGDFDVFTYPVPSDLASCIRWYRETLVRRCYSPGKYLFNIRYYYDYVKAPESVRRNSIFLYQHLKNTLGHYYRHYYPGGTEPASFLNLGDTRHLAMISLIISGGSPVICRELAGHGNIEISSHYYSNIASLVECATYELYRKASRGSNAAMASRSPGYDLSLPPKRTRVEGGWCGSVLFAGRSVEDCIRSVGIHAELGVCENCRFFCPDRQGMLFHFEDTAYNRERVKADSWFLMFITESVRYGGGTTADLQSAFLRLQNSCQDYQAAILHSLKQTEV